MKLTLGCTTRPYAKLDFAEACKRIAAAGYTDVAVFSAPGLEPDSDPKEARMVRRVADDAGLVPSMLLAQARLGEAADLDKAESDYRRLIDRATVLGASWLLDLGTGQEEHLEPYVALMKRVAPYAQQAGIQITVKPHGGITRTTDDLIAVYERVDHPAFSLCYDPGNIIYYTQGDERPETAIDRVAPMVRTGIIKDCVVRDGKPDVMITPGEGWVDFGAVLGGLVRGGFCGPLYVECVGGSTVEEIDRNLRKTRDYIQTILDRLPS